MLNVITTQQVVWCIVISIVILAIAFMLDEYNEWNKREKLKKELKQESKDDIVQITGNFTVKFFHNNTNTITIKGMPWESVLSLKAAFNNKLIDPIVNQNFQSEDPGKLRTQIDLKEIYYIEYLKEID